MRRKKRAIPFLTCCILFAIFWSACSKNGHMHETVSATEQTMELSFITIGKGDAFLLKTPENTFYMYDTGKKEDYAQIKKTLEAKQVSEIKGIFLSHGHKDHVGNVKHLLKDYPVETVYISGADQASYEGKEICELDEKYPITIKYLKEETLNLEGVTADIWVPKRCDFQNPNNNSMIIRFSYGEQSCLLTGDMEYGEEAAYLQSGAVQETEILKLGHHGENDTTSVAFLEKTKPRYGLITGNTIENPDTVNPEIKARLETFDIETFYSEGEQLAWDFILDGENITIEKLEEKGE